MIIGDFVLSPTMIWIGIAVIFAVVEALTMGLTTIWFSGGALVAAVVSMVTGSILIQVVVFLAVSIVLLYFTKPLAEKKLHVGAEKTNVDAVIGRRGVVTQEIKPMYPGQVRVWGQDWTAVADVQGETIPVDSEVVILRVEGVKLVVTAGIAEN